MIADANTRLATQIEHRRKCITKYSCSGELPHNFSLKGAVTVPECLDPVCSSTLANSNGAAAVPTRVD
jgi:hypothetical protein